VAAVIARVRRLPDAAPGPVDLAGYSNGAKLALLVACDDPGLVAGVATYGAVPAADCPHRPAVSLLEMAGADDPELTIGPGGTPVVDSGYTEERVTTVVTTELRADGCTSTTDTARAGRVTETLWPSCRDGRRVGLVVYAGQAHTWPQTDGATPSAQQVMWDWFVALGTVAA
jgi:polyhydroxybutyrate depolymerase